MRFLRYETEHGPRWGIVAGEKENLADELTGAPWAVGTARTGVQRPIAMLRLVAPAEPTKIVCVGRNYRAHAKELGNEVPKEPLLFLKSPSALLKPNGEIFCPPESDDVQHEAELGVVIGRKMTRVSPENVRPGIFGLTCVNDVTARDLQRAETQFTRAKSFDTFCPVGPSIVTGVSWDALSVKCRVNGELRQDGNTRDFVFPVERLVSFASCAMTLYPGDIISTGTPAGVSRVVPGDLVEVEIEGVGLLVNRVVGV